MPFVGKPASKPSYVTSVGATSAGTGAALPNGHRSPVQPDLPGLPDAPRIALKTATKTSALLKPADSPAVQIETKKPQPAAPDLAVETGFNIKTQTKPRPSKSAGKSQGSSKLFVLDTNVLLHDPMCLFRFEEHDIFLPMIVLEELDGHKKGMTEVARNARQTSRSLDALAGSNGADIGIGLALDTTGHREAKGKLYFQTQALDFTLPSSLPQGKADNQILGVVEALRKLHAPRSESGTHLTDRKSTR